MRHHAGPTVCASRSHRCRDAHGRTMDSIAVEAIAALEAALNGLMPVPVPAGLTRSTRVLTQRIRPCGLGGYIGVHQDPTASLYGRRLNARVEVSIAAGAPADASAYAATLSGQ